MLVSPTTGTAISSARFGILMAMLFMPKSALWGRAFFAFFFAIAGTRIFVWFILIHPIQFKGAIRPPAS